jgi:hypothetical protein
VVHGLPDLLPNADFQVVENQDDASVIATFQSDMNYGDFSDYVTFAPSEVAFEAQGHPRRLGFNLSQAHQSVLTFVTSPRKDSTLTGTQSTFTVRAYDSDGQVFYPTSITSVPEEDRELPNELALHGNYPNPFNPTTTISFDLPEAQRVSLRVFNLLGQEVTTLLNDKVSAGSHQVTFDAQNLTSGVYIYRLQTRSKTLTKKMMLMK